jgi:hypothetical protein
MAKSYGQKEGETMKESWKTTALVSIPVAPERCAQHDRLLPGGEKECAGKREGGSIAGNAGRRD